MKNKLTHWARKMLYLTIGRRNFEYRYHRRSGPLRKAETARAIGESTEDAALISRIVAAYQQASHQTFGDSMWTGFFNDLHRDVHEALMANANVAEFLRNPATCDLFYGFENLSRSLLAAPRIEDTDDPAQALDSLICFAEALAVLRMENHESYGLRLPRPAPHADAILDLIESHLRVKLPVPNPYPNEYGLRTRRGVLSYRAAQSMYQAWRIRELVAGIKNPRVIEIGAGLGRTAFYARSMGIAEYAIVDVPLSTVAQAYFLGRTLGPASVSIGNEVRRPVHVQTPEQFFADTATYDLAINVDSLTELDRGIAEQYLSALSTRAKTLLSINRESNAFTVAELTTKYSVCRCPCWNRRGYVEEVVTF